MTTDARKGTGDWRGSKSARPGTGPKRTAATKWGQAAILSTMMLTVAGLAVWLVLLYARPTNPDPYFVPFWVGTYQDSLAIPTIPWTRADHAAIVGGDKEKRALFSKIDSKEATDPALEAVQARLDGLHARADDDSVVVYISAYAVVDTEGKIRIMTRDSHPYEPETQLPLSKVLDSLQKCPSRNKLLVLDIMRKMLDPRDVGGTADGVGDLVHRELRGGKAGDELNDSSLMVICACSPGESAQGSENLANGRSAFGYFFERALTTSAADADNDNSLDVRELQGYLARSVDEWALRYRGVHQVPYLDGATDHNFKLKGIRATDTGGGLASLWPWGKSKTPATADSSADEPPADAAGSGEKTQDETSDAAPSKEKTDGESSATEKKASATDKTQKATTKEADKAAEKGAYDHASPSRGREYPEWMADGWNTFERWWQSGDYQAAPRAFRRLGAILLRAERRWRGGDKASDVQGELKRELQARGQDMDRAKKITLPIVRSAGLAVAVAGQQPDAALKTAIGTALAEWRKIDPNDPKSAEAKTGIEKGLVGQLKGKTPIELALAVIAATQARQLDRATLAFLDSVVDRSREVFDDQDPRGQVVELRFLHQLADRAKSSPSEDWWDMDKAWKTVCLAEQVRYHPRSLSWLRASLDEADAVLHDAQVLLLTQPSGYASWKEKLDTAWENASKLCGDLRDQQHAIEAAQTTFSKTLTLLAFLVPCLEAKSDPELQQDWLDAARAARDVAVLLDPPGENERSRDQVVTRVNKLRGEAEKLDGKCKDLLSRFGPDPVNKLVADCRSDATTPDPKRIGDIEALLATPLLSASDRRRLRDAERILEARLEKSDGTGAGTDGAKGTPARTRVGDRIDRIVEFLKLGELPGIADAKLSLSGADVDKLWGTMSDIAKDAYLAFDDRLHDEKQIDAIDPAGLLAPVYALRLADANAASGEDNPSRAAREGDSLKACSWLAAHYWHQSLDLPDLADADKFYEGAATTCPAESDFTPEAYPLIRVLDVKRKPLTDKDPARLSTEHPQGKVVLDLRLEKARAANAMKAELGVIRSADSRLRVMPLPKEWEISGESNPLEVAFELSGEENGSRIPPPSEFFVALRMENGRKYHARIPISIVTGDLIPRLVLSTDPASVKKLTGNKIRLRPIPDLRQPYYVFVENLTDKAVAVTVSVVQGSTIRARGGTREKPIKVAAGTSEPVRSFDSGPIPKEGEPLTKLTEPIALQLRDPSNDDLIDELRLPVIVASPSEYVQVTTMKFIPERPGFPNRLEIVVNALPGMGDRPCPVELVLPDDLDLFPAFRGQPKEGNQQGSLVEGGRPVMLYVEGIPLNPNVNDALPSYFYLNADGIDKADAVKRAFWFKTTFRQDGNRQPVAQDKTPRVRFVAERMFPKNAPARLVVNFAVDNPPPGAKLMFQIDRDDAGVPVTQPGFPWSRPATDRRLGFDIKGDTGALVFEASEKDWVGDFKVAGLHGLCQLQARLVDATGKTVAPEYRVSMELDDRPPQNMRIGAPPTIERGTPEIEVEASATPPPSLKEVTFIVGTKRPAEADFDKADQDGKAFKGEPVGIDGRTWKARIKVPPDAGEKFLVTARFKPVAGITGLESTDVSVVDPPPAPKKKAEPAMEGPKVGSIEGKVTVGDRPQPDLIVYLLDPEPNTKKFVVAQVTTSEKGTYTFKDVPPKTYTVYGYKMSEGRKAAQQAIVKAGETTTVNLSLVQ